ncbi:32783_t:CDS:1, partial [Racocetra persica]
ECVEYNSVTGSFNIKMEMIILYASQSVKFKHLGESGLNIKVGNIYLISEFVKFSDSGKIMIEATDIDYQKSSIYNSNVIEIPSDKPKSRSIIDIIADDIESVNSNNQSSTLYAKINSTLEKKNESDLDVESNTKEPESGHKKEKTTFSDEYTKELQSDEEEKAILSDEYTKLTDENEEQEDEEQPKKRKRSIR